MVVTVVAVLILLVLSALFSGSETAFTGSSQALMHEKEREGDRRARLVNRLLSDRERLIGAILLGNNLVNILASALATTALVAVFGEAGVAYATVAMTLLVLVFSEILPKTYALRNPNAISLAAAPVMHGVVWVLTPFIAALMLIVRTALTVVGRGESDDSDRRAGLAELRGVIAMHTQPEIQHEKRMLKSVLDLNDLEVGEIMTHRSNMVTVSADLGAAEIVDRVLHSPYTRVPLWQGEPDNVVGVIHAKSLLREVRARNNVLDGLNVLDHAAAPWFIPDTTPLLAQLQAFRTRREHFALVVDEYGTLQGLVTLEDILEEIVGDITDEHDIPITGVRPQPDGSYIVHGAVPLRDLEREFDWAFDTEDVSTIAGLVLQEARRIPTPGEVYLFNGYRMEILRRQGNRITLLRIRPPDPAGPEADTP